MTRWAGIDYGTRRIGVALSDYGGRIASPATVLPGAGNAPRDADLVLAWAGENEVAALVVGLPISMDGTDSDQTRLTRAFADALRQRGRLPVELWDERLSSFQADELLNAAEVPRARRKGQRDALAALVVLQAFLDRQAPDP